MQITADLTTAYRLTLQHRNTFNGCYSAEDDFELSIIGDSLDDCIKKIIPLYLEAEYSEQGIHAFENASFTELKKIIYNGVTFYSYDFAYIKSNLIDILYKLKNSDQYLKLKKIKEAELVKKQEEQDKADETRVRANELSLLKSLKEKYEINT